MSNGPVTDRFVPGTPDEVKAGEDLDICFHNASLANQTVTITLTDGGSQSDEVEIDLDSNGDGCTTWPVPSTGWSVVNCKQATSADHPVQVDH